MNRKQALKFEINAKLATCLQQHQNNLRQQNQLDLNFCNILILLIHSSALNAYCSSFENVFESKNTIVNQNTK